MSTEYTQSTSTTSARGRTGSCIAEPSASAIPPINASCNTVYTQRPFIESLALAITHEHKQIPLPGIMGDLVFTGADIPKFTEAEKCLSFCTGTDQVAEDNIAFFPL